MVKKNSRFIVPAKALDAGKSEHKYISVIIPAAGLGSRMKSYGPKCLFPTLNGSTILNKIIHNVQKVYPHCEIIVATGFEADRVIESVPKDIRIVENQLYDTTNMVESIRLSLNNAIYNDIIIINGDLIFNVYTLQNITKQGSCVLIDTQDRFQKNEIGVTAVEGSAVHFSYGLPTKWAQIVYLTGVELNLFKTFCSDRENNKRYTFEILNMVIENGGSILADEPKGMQIIEVDSIKDIPRWDK
jgi:choline kinase